MELTFRLELEVAPHRVFAVVTESRPPERRFRDNRPRALIRPHGYYSPAAAPRPAA